MATGEINQLTERKGADGKTRTVPGNGTYPQNVAHRALSVQVGQIAERTVTHNGTTSTPAARSQEAPSSVSAPTVRREPEPGGESSHLTEQTAPPTAPPDRAATLITRAEQIGYDLRVYPDDTVAFFKHGHSYGLTTVAIAEAQIATVEYTRAQAKKAGEAPQAVAPVPPAPLPPEFGAYQQRVSNAGGSLTHDGTAFRLVAPDGTVSTHPYWMGALNRLWDFARPADGEVLRADDADEFDPDDPDDLDLDPDDLDLDDLDDLDLDDGEAATTEENTPMPNVPDTAPPPPMLRDHDVLYATVTGALAAELRLARPGLVRLIGAVVSVGRGELPLADDDLWNALTERLTHCSDQTLEWVLIDDRPTLVSLLEPNEDAPMRFADLEAVLWSDGPHAASAMMRYQRALDALVAVISDDAYARLASRIGDLRRVA